jgi:uncharacterized cupin superfamily protein
MTPRIISFRDGVEPSHSTPEADRLVTGQPRLTVWNHYADGSGQFFAGVWSATRGEWRVRYSEHELCHLLAGRVVIESTGGERYEFVAGDTFVIPAGFSGTWEVLEDCRKIYAIFEQLSPASATVPHTGPEGGTAA